MAISRPMWANARLVESTSPRQPSQTKGRQTAFALGGHIDAAGVGVGGEPQGRLLTHAVACVICGFLFLWHHCTSRRTCACMQPNRSQACLKSRSRVSGLGGAPDAACARRGHGAEILPPSPIKQLC